MELYKAGIIIIVILFVAGFATIYFTPEKTIETDAPPAPQQEQEQVTTKEEPTVPEIQKDTESGFYIGEVREAPELSLQTRRKIVDGTWSIPLRFGDRFVVTHGAKKIEASIFDEGWNRVETKTLHSGSPEANDHQSAVLGNDFFVAYSASVDGHDDSLFLLKFDSTLNRIDSAAVVDRAAGAEVTNDMFLTAADGRLYIGTFVTPPEGSEEPHHMRVRVYDTQLRHLETAELLGAMQNGGSLIAGPEAFVYVTGAGFGERDLHALEYEDWELVDNLRLTRKSADEYWPMGGLYEEGYYYVAHVENEEFNPEFCPTCDMGTVVVKVFDEDWELVDEVEASPEGVLAHRPHLLRHDGRLYVGYDTAAGESGPFEGWVAEFREN